jgi:hypothetical protein
MTPRISGLHHFPSPFAGQDESAFFTEVILGNCASESNYRGSHGALPEGGPAPGAA